jgi:hypothetical protein
MSEHDIHAIYLNREQIATIARLADEAINGVEIRTDGQMRSSVDVVAVLSRRADAVAFAFVNTDGESRGWEI